MMKTQYFDQLDYTQVTQINYQLLKFKDNLAMRIDMVDGFFAGLHCLPNTQIDEYIPFLWGGSSTSADNLFNSQEESILFFKQIKEHWINVGNRLNQDDMFIPLIIDEDSPGSRWAEGFLRAINFCELEWLKYINDPKNFDKLLPIYALAEENQTDLSIKFSETLTKEKRGALLRHLSLTVSDIYQYFSNYRDSFNQHSVVKRIIPVMGRNAPCACGSGKKYKKCCASPVIWH
jgi:uncharacterized protein